MFTEKIQNFLQFYVFKSQSIPSNLNPGSPKYLVSCHENTRKAGSHYQIVILYNDFKSYHDTSKVPPTVSQTWVMVSTLPPTNTANDSPTPIKQEEHTGSKSRQCWQSPSKNLRSPTVRFRWDKVMSNYTVSSKQYTKGCCYIYNTYLCYI